MQGLLGPVELCADFRQMLLPAVALYAQLYLRTVKNAGKEYFYGIMRDLEYRCLLYTSRCV